MHDPEVCVQEVGSVQCLRQHRGRITGYAEVIRSPTLDRWVVSASGTRSCPEVGLGEIASNSSRPVYRDQSRCFSSGLPLILQKIDTCNRLGLVAITFLSNNAFGVMRDLCLVGAHFGF